MFCCKCNSSLYILVVGTLNWFIENSIVTNFLELSKHYVTGSCNKNYTDLYLKLSLFCKYEYIFLEIFRRLVVNIPSFAYFNSKHTKLTHQKFILWQVSYNCQKITLQVPLIEITQFFFNCFVNASTFLRSINVFCEFCIF